MSDKYLAALQQAKYIADHRGSFDRQGKMDAIVSLAQWGCFSTVHISLFTGVRQATVLELVRKPDRTGGRLTIEALPHIIHIIHLEARGQVDNFAVKRAVDAGCSLGLLARLTGQSVSTLRRRNFRAEEMTVAA